MNENHDSPAVRWMWVRHFPIASQGIYVGQTDLSAEVPPVSALALGVPADAVWLSSPLARAQQTMRWLRQSLALPEQGYVTVPELMEQHFGAWEGQRYDAVSADMDWSHPETIQPPRGESFLDVMKRVHAWLAQAVDQYAGKTVVAVCHAGPIRAGLGHALASSAWQALRFHLDYASMSQVTYFHYQNAWSGRVDGVNMPLVQQG